MKNLIDLLKRARHSIIPLGTLILAMLAQPALAVNLTFAPSCSDPADRQAIQSAVNRAATWANDGYVLVRDNEAVLRNNAPNAYRDWFGNFSDHRYQRVLAVLDGVRFKLNSDSTLLAHCRVDPADPCDQNGDIAATDARVRGDFQMWFCNEFFALPANLGHDTQAGSVVHEMTHSIGNTEDIPGAYGTAAAANLAIHQPDQAVDNADNYEYFLEQLYD